MENKSRHNAETLMIELVLEERNACKMGSVTAVYLPFFVLGEY